MTVEDNCSASAVSRYRRHDGPDRCRSRRHGRLGATCGSARPSRGRVVLTCRRKACRTHSVSAAEFAWVSCQRRSWRGNRGDPSDVVPHVTLRTRLQSWKSVQSAECTACFRLSIQHVRELERVECSRLAGQYDAETYALSRWRHKRPRPHHASPPPKRPRFAAPAILEPPEDMRPMEIPLEDRGMP